jgi:hypothetical protein
MGGRGYEIAEVASLYAFSLEPRGSCRALRCGARQGMPLEVRRCEGPHGYN